VSHALQVFVSSTCHELRDLRAAIRAWLVDLGMQPVMSDDPGFQHADGMPPYAACLRALEDCPLVIVVIDRRYGQSFEDWGPYQDYKGYAPTHAEVQHAIKLGKRAFIYVHQDVWNFYEVWRQNPAAISDCSIQGLDVKTLLMFQDLKHMQPAPWIEKFENVSDVIKSLRLEFVNLSCCRFG